MRHGGGERPALGVRRTVVASPCQVCQGELKETVAQTQVLYAVVLEQYWAKRHPEAHSARPVGFNTDAHGVFLYPPGFDEPTDAAYQAQARAMDAALIRAWRCPGKPA